MQKLKSTNMLRATSLIIAVAAGLLASACAEKAPKVATVIDGLESPESVLIVGDRRFVSNIGHALDPLAKDGDGYISELSADGKIVTQRAFPAAGETLDAPKGMASVDGKLYVADIDRVVGFDLASGARIFEQRLPGDQPSFANDLAATEDGQLLVSDTLRGAVYRLDPKSGTFTPITNSIPGANGIVVDPKSKQIFVVGLGENFGGGDVFSIDGTGKATLLENSPHGFFDGLAMTADGQLIVSDWKAVDKPTPGALFTLSTANGAVGDIRIEREIHGPADFALDNAKGTLWIPATLDNQIVIVELGKSSGY